MRALLLLPLLLAACAAPPRAAVELAGEIRRAPPSDAMADRDFDCAVADRACLTLWLARGAACARLAEAPATPAPARAARRDCAVAAFVRSRELMPGDATAAERQEAAIRLADALERRRDRALGAVRAADNAAILAAVAPLAGTAAAGQAAHYAAGVALNRVQAGDIPPAARCAALAEAAAKVAGAADLPGLPPLGARLAARRAALAAEMERCPR